MEKTALLALNALLTQGFNPNIASERAWRIANEFESEYQEVKEQFEREQ